MSRTYAIAAAAGRVEGKRLAYTVEGAVIEGEVVDLVATVTQSVSRRVRFFPIPDDIEGALLTREGL